MEKMCLDSQDRMILHRARRDSTVEEYRSYSSFATIWNCSIVVRNGVRFRSLGLILVDLMFLLLFPEGSEPLSAPFPASPA